MWFTQHKTPPSRKTCIQHITKPFYGYSMAVNFFYFWSLEHDQCVPHTNLNAATVFALIWNIAAMADSSAATWVTNVTAQVRRHFLWPTLSSYTRAPYAHAPEFLLSKIIAYRANVCYLDNIVSVLWKNRTRFVLNFSTWLLMSANFCWFR
jgi:hypothetical protein